MKNFIRRIKDRINAFLERLAESNKKEFGTKRMDCCDLKDSPSKKSH
ncbi:MAG: LDCC motif putative metal-binding protein [Candidatus Delongbacteria bacterium]|jgi:hypothetical protein|nr:LDCC motif putative metal-binding protein [Candidatus Delongbacteria bacterium]